MKAIFLKEWRQAHLLAWAALLVSAMIVALYGLWMAIYAEVPADAELAGGICGLLLLVALVLLAIVATSGMLASEIASGTIGYLLTLPISRSRLWLGKVLRLRQPYRGLRGWSLPARRRRHPQPARPPAGLRSLPSRCSGRDGLRDRHPFILLHHLQAIADRVDRGNPGSRRDGGDRILRRHSLPRLPRPQSRRRLHRRPLLVPALYAHLSPRFLGGLPPRRTVRVPASLAAGPAGAAPGINLARNRLVGHGALGTAL